MVKTKTLLFRFIATITFCLTFCHQAIGEDTPFDELTNSIQESTDSMYFENILDSIAKRGNNSIYEKIEFLNVLIERTKELNFELLSAKGNHYLSIQKTLQGKLTEAFELEKLALPIFEKYHSSMMVEVYNNTGSMLSDLGSTAEGIKNLNKAISLTEDFKKDIINYHYLTINNFLVLGNIYYQDNQLGLAKKMFQFADSIASINLDATMREKCYSLLNLANIDMKENKPALSLIKSKKVYTSSKNRNFNEIEAYCNIKISQAYKMMNNLDSSILYADIAEKFAKKYNYFNIQNVAIHLKGKIYKQFNLHEKSSIEFQRYIKAREKFDENNSQAISNYFTHIAEKEAKINSSLALEQAEQKQKTRQLKLIIVFGGLFLLLTIGFIYWFQRRKLKEQIKKEQMEKQLLSSQITAIRSQMNPHFIFNCLNSIQSLVLKKEVESTYDYISKFAFLVRSIMQQSSSDMIPLEEEVATLNLYLELEELRFKNDFSFKIKHKVQDEIEIPPLLIQPFVENAIKHGLLHKDGLKELEINLMQKNNIVECIITDNGIGRKASAGIKERQNIKHKSFSTTSTNTRFELMQNRLDIKGLGIEIKDLLDSEGEPLGTTVKLMIPCKILY